MIDLARVSEIETALRTYPDVQDAVVTVDGCDESRRLLGYVLRSTTSADQTTTQLAHMNAWQDLFDGLYQQGSAAEDFNVVGWRNSYTGASMPPAEIRMSVEDTAERLRALRPRRVVEIGCGAGMLLKLLAPTCERYVGIDFSHQVLLKLRNDLAEQNDLSHVELHEGLAHELTFLETSSVDLVILDSVVQYFPDIE